MELGMVGFVDDSNGQTNEFMSDENALTLPTIYHKLRHNAQAWADLLGASGGALELSKCSCHLLRWQFGVKGDPVLVRTKPENPLEVTEKREISRRLTAIYDQRNHMEPSAQSLLFSEIRHHLEQPPWVIQNWITINGPVFMASLRTVKAKAIQNVRSIQTYFAPR